jgi:uncharacterized protein (DUF2236 family)
VSATVAARPRPLGPDALAWDLIGDWRVLLLAGRALALQVGHPVIAGGVDRQSVFLTDPWGRLFRSLRALLTYFYGGEEAAREAASVRTMHDQIRGIDWAGRAYEAWDPEAYFFVHASTFETLVVQCEHFGRPLTAAETARLYEEFRQVGLLLGIAEDHMPATLDDFWRWYERILEGRLEDNHVVHQVLDRLADIPPPRWWRLPRWAWRPIVWMPGRVLRVATIGTLPPMLRARWGLQWTRRDARALRRLSVAVRAVGAVTPARVRFMPIAAGARRAATRATGN